jgi:hypothetical protein
VIIMGRVGIPGISNHVGPIKLFLSILLFSLKRVFSFAFFKLCIDDPDSLVI